MASLQLILLGGFQARAAGQEIDVPGRKERALLAFLAIPPGESRSRDKLAGLLWSDRGDSQARDSLKQAIFKLRKSLDGVQPSPLLADREFVSLERAAVAVDVAEFEQLIGEGTTESLARAAALYRGDLLDGLDLRDAAFDEWLLMERQRLRDLARDALARLVDWHMSSGALDQAATTARRLLAIDPLREAAHRGLMRIYVEQGQTALALKQYQLCRDTLQSELGVRPEAETERLYQSIQENRGISRRTAGQPPALQAAAETRLPLDAIAPAHDLEAGPSTAKPSIAVLPFTNLSADPEQDYFADGIVEDIISGLTRLRWLFVIARDSSFIFKGKAIDIRQVGRELGVRYLLEGSVRRAGDRIRIASELLDSATGTHIWADHFDGALSDIFDLQDQITASVVGAIEPKLRHAEIERARRKPTESVDAYDLFLRAVALNATRKKEDNREALRLLYRAIEIDPRYATAYAVAGYCYVRQYAQCWVSPSDPAMTEGIRVARLAAEYGQDDPEALWMAGVTMSVIAGDPKDGLALIDRSLALNPNSANALMASGLVRAFTGDSDAAMAPLERSRQLSPLDPIAYGTSLGFAWVHFVAGRYQEAAAWCDKTQHEAPTHYPPAVRMNAACCGLLGRLEEGRKWVEQLLAANPDTTLSSVKSWYQLMIKKPDVLNALLDGLRKAGLPD